MRSTRGLSLVTLGIASYRNGAHERARAQLREAVELLRVDRLQADPDIVANIRMR